VRTVRGVLVLVATAATVAILLQGGGSEASTVRAQPSLSALVAEARQLSNEVDSLGQQYDGLRIQMSHAKTEERLAKLAASRAAKALTGSQQAVAQLAAMGYMDQGLSPTLQMLTSGNPGQFLNQASVVQELDNQAGERLSSVQKDQIAAARAQVTAREQIATVNQLQAEINSKVSAIHAKLGILNSAAMSQAMAIFQQTGSYPNVVLPEVSTIGLVALRAALTRRGDPYVWAMAGPSEFDCSGLVVWAFAQEGISLPHYTGSLWNSGMHVSRADLEPGDLLFFFQDISHVAFYLGDGLMLDAPSSGQVVQVQPIWWNLFVGAVRIA
jgi:peptidoglycan DL-endopeptidase CwlO